jgi:hypothetical protein
MKQIVTLAFATLCTIATVQAQTSDLVLFTDDGAKFTLVIDGEVRNAEPSSRVVATGIRNDSPVIMIRFADAAIPQFRKAGYFPLGMEYTVMITTNKKGERVLRQTGEAALGTAVKAEPEKPKPTTFVEDAPVTVQPASTTGVTQTVDVDGVDQVTTVVVVEEEPMEGGSGENININMGVNGMGINMTVKMDEGVGTAPTTARTTTRTTTTTTTTSAAAATARPQPTPAAPAPAPVKEPEVYRMPGYSGPIGCGMPMSSTEFADARKSIESKSFEETKMTMAKQIGRDRCFTVDQVKSVMGTFSFEDSKLEFAKYAYDRTHDIGNYYKLNDAFTFESSVDDLNTFLESR